MSKRANVSGPLLAANGAVCESLCESKPDSASATPPPSGELPPAEPELFERAREAVGALRGRGRQANGQAGRQNTLALRHGLTSKQLVQQPDVAAWHQEQIAAIETDLGGPAELSSLARASVREVARLEVILGAMGDELLAHGVLTGKGKTRAATTTYLQVLDRFAKLANTLGLARQQKSLPSPAEYWAQKQQNGAAG